MFNPKWLLFIVLIAMLGCNNDTKIHPFIVNYSDAEVRADFDIKRLDSSYVNLLSTINNEEEGDSLYNLWLFFHKQLNEVLNNKKFDWGIEDSTVIIWDRVYCKKDGEIDYYIYNIADTLISTERKKAFGEFIKTLKPQLKYPVKKDTKYAQCGTYRHHISQSQNQKLKQ